MTDETITIGNAADVTGPVPGLYESARQGVAAYVAYFNATSSICGRRLVLDARDTRTEEAGDAEAYAAMCEGDLAAVGSMSAYDGGGAFTGVACGLPDLRAGVVSDPRGYCRTCYPLGGASDTVPATVGTFLQGSHRGVARATIVHVDTPGAQAARDDTLVGLTAAGITVPTQVAVSPETADPADVARRVARARPDVLALVAVPWQLVLAVQQALADLDAIPRVVLLPASVLDSPYAEQAGPLGEGGYTASTTDLLDDGGAEMRLYREWLATVAPGARPTSYGVYAWSATRLFTDVALDLGADLSRANLIGTVNTMPAWRGHGLHGPVGLAAREPTSCVRVLRLHDGVWTPVSGPRPACSPAQAAVLAARE